MNAYHFNIIARYYRNVINSSRGVHAASTADAGSLSRVNFDFTSQVNSVYGASDIHEQYHVTESGSVISQVIKISRLCAFLTCIFYQDRASIL
jgi:hypothetical protein